MIMFWGKWNCSFTMAMLGGTVPQGVGRGGSGSPLDRREDGRVGTPNIWNIVWYI